MASVPIAEAATQLPALIARAAAGELVEITQGGHAVATLVAAAQPAPAPAAEQARPPFDWAALEALIAKQPPQPDSGEFVRQMRDEYRY